MVASRFGKTTVEENILGYFVDYEPCPMQFIFPSEILAKRFSKINLKPMIRDNPHLSEKFVDTKLKTDDNEILYKKFLGGHIVLSGANAPSSLSMYSMRVVMFDEVDRFPASAGDEGDPIELGKQRAENFLNRKFVYASTPTIEEISRIEQLYNESDKRMLETACPFCNHMQILIFGPRSKYAALTTGFLRYRVEGNNVYEVEYVCSNCKKGIPEKWKAQMIQWAVWKKTRPEIRRHAGFQANRLLSPWSTWTDMALKFERAKRKPEKLKVWVNTSLGETFSLKVNYQFEEDKLLSRREWYEKIPKGVVIMTIGVDTQDNRLEAVLKGWGLNDESWFIEKIIVWGSPGEESTWSLLENFIFKTREYENGYRAEYGQLGGVYAVAVDSGGHHAKSAYEFAKKYFRSRVFAVKGQGGFGRVFVRPANKKRVNAPLIIVGVDAGKELIYQRLQLQQMKDEHGMPLPTPGYMHFNQQCDKNYFDQLISERPIVVGEGLKKTIHWDLPDGKQNEMLDCENYALAAYALLEIKNMSMLAEELHARMDVYEKQKSGDIENISIVQKDSSQENQDDSSENNTLIQIDI